MERTVKILALAGSYRRASLNQALITAAREEAPASVDFREFDLREVPFYDGDVEEAGLPPEVERLKAAVREADALLLVSPEYNSGIPAVLKNGIDWSSRVYPDAPISGKLAAIIGATPGGSGTKFAQEQLRQVVGRAGAVLIEAPEVMLARAGEAIEDGQVRSGDVRAKVRAVVEALEMSVRLCVDEGSLAAVM